MNSKAPLEATRSSSKESARFEERTSDGSSIRDLPSVTVIMPIRNEAAYIERSLGAVLSQDYPPQLVEVLIADGMSSDTTREIIQRLSNDHPQVRMRVIDNEAGIVPTGFNRAILQAQGDIIVRVDGHTVVAPDYVRECVDALRRSRADNVGGRMVPVSQGAFGLAVALATSSPFGVGGARFHYSQKEEWVDTVYLGAWPRDVFRRIGLFDEEQVRNQDDEFNYRLLSSGGSILLTPKIKSTYFNRASVKGLFKQYYQYGFWKVRVIQKHMRQLRWRQIVPPAFVFAFLVLLALSPFSQAARLGFALLVGAYLLANVAASTIAGRTNWHSVPILLIVFPILHISYGLGVIVGLVRFWNRWGRSRASPQLG
jgi:glycosyltransferase involved in cell wall biosynthesis